MQYSISGPGGRPEKNTITHTLKIAELTQTLSAEFKSCHLLKKIAPIRLPETDIISS